MALFDGIDDRPRLPRILVVGEDLSDLSVAELQERAEALRAEIERVERAAMEKLKLAAAAAAVFRI